MRRALWLRDDPHPLPPPAGLFRSLLRKESGVRLGHFGGVSEELFCGKRAVYVYGSFAERRP